SRSRGSERKYWRSRKISKAPPKKWGTINGRCVLIQPSCLKMRKSGIKRTWKGSIMALRVKTKNISRPGQRKRAKEKATSDELKMVPITDNTAIMSVFIKYVVKPRL